MNDSDGEVIEPLRFDGEVAPLLPDELLPPG
jgi:hypothetical protein